MTPCQFEGQNCTLEILQYISRQTGILINLCSLAFQEQQIIDDAGSEVMCSYFCYEHKIYILRDTHCLFWTKLLLV